MQDHVELVPEGLAEVRPKSIVTSSGREIEVDVIAYCTGYRILDFDRVDVVGEEGRSLAKAMEEAPEAYKGIVVPHFPNYFFAVGPNGLVLNVPYFITVEQNVATIVRLLRDKQKAGARVVDVKEDVNREYNDWMLERFPLYSWGNASCNSYYRFDNGRAPFLFPGDFKTYQQMQSECSLDEFELA
jgi:cation diffusion facilitator CzcD-associated flavoprotein CzcO